MQSPGKLPCAEGSEPGTADLEETPPSLQAGASPTTCSVVTRLASSKGFEAVFTRQAQALRDSWRCGDGKQWMRSGGYEQQDISELQEVLLKNSRTYHQYDDDCCESDGGYDSED